MARAPGEDRIVFGTNPQAANHAFRYADALGLSREAVKLAIIDDLLAHLPLPAAVHNLPCKGTVIVAGTRHPGLLSTARNTRLTCMPAPPAPGSRQEWSRRSRCSPNTIWSSAAAPSSMALGATRSKPMSRSAAAASPPSARSPARATEEIDARGKLVTPGFVDIHTHYDAQAMWDCHLAPSSWHGVTTAVMGNCGVGFAPCKPADREKLIELMEGVEDIPGAVMHEGLRWDWESFGEYLDALDRRQRDIDVCALLPHAAVRVFVMGERAIALENANQGDIAQMREIAREAMQAGAFGFSTSRSLSHKTLKGDPTPTLRAQEDELTGIAMGMRDAGSGMLEIVSEWAPDHHAEFAMLRRVVEACGRPRCSP